MQLFTVLLYQPFLNILVLFYWLVGQLPIGYDMGIAVILLTVLIRVLLLPLTIAGHRTEHERRQIEQKVARVKEEYSAQPLEKDKAIKRVLRANPRIILSEVTMFVIQLIIALVLWRIFATGLLGKDLHLLYSWIPDVPQPYNLTFLGRFDLTHPDWQLNVVQASLIFIIETIAVLTSPYEVTRKEVVRVQLVLPVVSFMIFAFLPAGKKLFVITTLSFSLVIIVARIFWRWYRRMQDRFNQSNAEDEPGDTSLASSDTLT